MAATPTMQIVSISGQTQTTRSIPLAKMVRLSNLARHIVQVTTPGRIPTMILRQTEVDLVAAERILDWIDAYDVEAPVAEQHLELMHLGTDDFNELVAMYAACNFFRVPRDLRGDALRDNIWHYIKRVGRLSANEFIMLYELLPFDFSIQKAIINDFFWARVRGATYTKYRSPADQDAEIEAYLKDVGVWEEVKVIEEEQKVHWANSLERQAKQRAWVVAENKAWADDRTEVNVQHHLSGEQRNGTGVDLDRSVAAGKRGMVIAGGGHGGGGGDLNGWVDSQLEGAGGNVGAGNGGQIEGGEFRGSGGGDLSGWVDLQLEGKGG
ncbi:unnamed protein product [Zymoseptoria tritici ST99CH_1E4]|uniref:Uncharacterized protein n=2 Tax=Zymoseptoria tritici TaxID=1047171 RepID=F9XEU8_ZYMTI|nr:uncharacterized protein MYCGRDRAFT_94732 [Zymoseptoria tritici IPO323]EGP85836.1 hypothetical protein MYCGRDRAFT_94732 [Zymoseptoria tritici IPO323]SMR55643.1 unnamed protein product [Zymoseptoria tritici ST99CH_1E4]